MGISKPNLTWQTMLQISNGCLRLRAPKRAGKIIISYIARPSVNRILLCRLLKSPMATNIVKVAQSLQNAKNRENIYFPDFCLLLIIYPSTFCENLGVKNAANSLLFKIFRIPLKINKNKQTWRALLRNFYHFFFEIL